jgi:hypothetical protein
VEPDVTAETSAMESSLILVGQIDMRRRLGIPPRRIHDACRPCPCHRRTVEQIAQEVLSFRHVYTASYLSLGRSDASLL